MGTEIPEKGAPLKEKWEIKKMIVDQQPIFTGRSTMNLKSKEEKQKKYNKALTYAQIRQKPGMFSSMVRQLQPL